MAFICRMSLYTPILCPLVLLTLQSACVESIQQNNSSNLESISNGTFTTIVATTILTIDRQVHGWVGQPNSRGTFDIAWNCLFTIFICTYTMLCLNVPSSDESSWDIMLRRLYWMIVAISGPEFVLTFASGQLGTAMESVKAFQAIGRHEWTIRYGFFADMGGFHIVPPTGKSFPVTGKQIHWLITHNYLDFPNVTIDEMGDKSKQDTIAKVISCIQIGYLVLQCIGRYAQGLTITTIELSALAIVICSIMTSLCWLNKPLDVRTPIRLPLKSSLERILIDAGDLAAKPYKQNPFDFIDDLCPSWSLNVQEFMGRHETPHERPIPRFGNDRFPSFVGWQKCILCLATNSYAAIHLLGWNFTFPTQAEKILWRTCSMFLLGNTVAFWVFEGLAMLWRVGRIQRLFCRIFWKAKLADVERARLVRLESREPKQLPLKWEFWSIFPLAWTYAAARGYLIIEVFLGLRVLDISAFYTVDWAKYIPHF